ncbi:MAG: NUDIX hydrolase [Caldilineales bacterium]
MITDDQLGALAARYGEPLHRTVECAMDETLFLSRFLRAEPRRGEAVLLIEQPDGRLLLHRKAHYGSNHFRLLTGGIRMGEAVDTAALREAQEETGLMVEIVRLPAVIHTMLSFAEIRLPFTSYLFHLRAAAAPVWAQDGEAAEFSTCLPNELPAVAATLRAIPDPRGYWGRWRAVAHEIAAEAWPLGPKQPSMR